MDNIQSDIAAVFAQLRVGASPLVAQDIARIVEIIKDNFCSSNCLATPLWAGIDGDSCMEEDWYGFVAEILSKVDGAAFLIIDDWSGLTGWQVVHGKVLGGVFKEMYNFQWYVTDSSGSFVLCRNDHNVIIHARRTQSPGRI